MTSPHVIVLHGGAGVEVGRDYSAAVAYLEQLVREIEAMLVAGCAAIDAVEFAIVAMEASGLFVAGKGSAANSDGYVELDASIMDGTRRRAGSVSALRDVCHPITAARRVMDQTSHVMLSGDGARAFAIREGLGLVDDPASYYVLPAGVIASDLTTEFPTRMHGTVGAVALDQAGRLAAGTSTGGVFGKLAGRVGDTPLIGSGTWADDEVAISCTGAGEYFILAGGAQDVASRVHYLGEALGDAAESLLRDVARLGGDGGLIAINRNGEVAFACNTPGMKRAAAGSAIEPFASL